MVGETYNLDENLLNRAAKEAFDYLGGDFEVNLSFVTPERIRELNRDYRHKDEVTDVLSFKLDPNVFGGDIAICFSELESDAKNLWKLPISEAAAFLLVHGILHLADYDHTNATDRAKMVKAEDEILAKVKINVER